VGLREWISVRMKLDGRALPVPRSWIVRRPRSLDFDDCAVGFYSSRPLQRSPRLVILVTMPTMPRAEVKAHLSEVVSRVNSQNEWVTVTVHGQASAVILAPDDVDCLQETIAVLADGALIRQLTESEADVAEGRVEDLDALAAAMREAPQF
jgi:antitoxin YefM